MLPPEMLSCSATETLTLAREPGTAIEALQKHIGATAQAMLDLLGGTTSRFRAAPPG